MEKSIVFFDGVCGLCSGFIDFIFIWDQKNNLKVASLQGRTASSKLAKSHTEQLDTIVFLKDNKTYTKSTAVLLILKELVFPWSFMGSILFVIPRFLRDFFYTRISASRYSIFGKSKTCRIPTKEEKEKFLE